MEVSIFIYRCLFWKFRYLEVPNQVTLKKNLHFQQPFANLMNISAKFGLISLFLLLIFFLFFPMTFWTYTVQPSLGVYYVLECCWIFWGSMHICCVWTFTYLCSWDYFLLVFALTSWSPIELCTHSSVGPCLWNPKFIACSFLINGPHKLMSMLGLLIELSEYSM